MGINGRIDDSMKLTHRFKRLTIWHKLSAIAAIIAIVFIPMQVEGWIASKKQSIKLDKRLSAIEKSIKNDPRLGADSLELRYPLGYAIIIIDGKRKSIDKLGNSQRFENFDVDWLEADILEFDKERMILRLPSIISKTHGIVISGNTINLPRIDDFITLYPITFPFGIDIWFELVKNKNDYTIAVIGAKQYDYAQ